MSMRIRKAEAADSKELADLACQLGYPVDEAKVLRGIQKIAESDGEAVLVAADEDNKVIAWTSLRIVETFYSRPTVEISGLVVDEDRRGQGIGKRLMAEAEAWARAAGHTRLRLRVNMTRKDALSFYERLGFGKTKEQSVYEKEVARRSP
jgi:GNAT superfamily N-acetyltransferase